MAPVTRLASKKDVQNGRSVAAVASSRKSPKPTPRSKATKSHIVQRRQPAKQAASPPLILPKEAAPLGPRARILEWYSISDPAFEDAEKLLWLVDVLREVHRQPGCDMVVRQTSQQSPIPKFFVIEWRDDEAREQYQKSEVSRRLTQVVDNDQVQKTFLTRVFHSPTGYLTQDYKHPFLALCEVITVYLPLNMSEEATKALDQIQGPMCFGGIMSHDPPKHPLEHPWEGLTGREHGWADGTAEYRGQPARRLVYMLWWLDELAQQRYREEAIAHDPTCDRRGPWNSLDVFYGELEDVGMLGYETRNAQFQEISKYYFPGDPGYVVGVNDWETLRKVC